MGKVVKIPQTHRPRPAPAPRADAQLAIARRPSPRDLLSLKAQLEAMDEDLVVAKHEAQQIMQRLRILALHVGTAGTYVESAVALYTRLVADVRAVRRRQR